MAVRAAEAVTRIGDVARAAGVSAATVSRVLNRPETVTDDKRRRVLRAIDELGYRPSAAARGLRSGSSHTLALLVGDIAQPFHGRLAKAVQRAAEAKGYSVLLGDLDHQQKRLVTLLRSLPARGVDGVIIATADNLDTAPVRTVLTGLTAQGIRVVSTSQGIEDPRVPVITQDHVAIARDATAQLLDQGKWPIAFLGAGPRSALSRQLRDGYLDACRDAGHDPSASLILDGRLDPDTAARAMTTLLTVKPRPQAAVALNTPMALGALSAAVDHGLTIPTQFALAVCEEVPLATCLRPTLTSVHTDYDAIAHHVINHLTSEIPPTDLPSTILMPHHLVIRQSSAPPQPRGHLRERP